MNTLTMAVPEISEKYHIYPLYKRNSMKYNLVFDSENHKNANIAGILVVFLRSKMSTISSFWFVLKYFSSFFA